VICCFEVMMSFAELGEYDDGDEEISCPHCGECLNKVNLSCSS